MFQSHFAPVGRGAGVVVLLSLLPSPKTLRVTTLTSFGPPVLGSAFPRVSGFVIGSGGFGDHETQGALELLLLAQVPVFDVPGA